MTSSDFHHRRSIKATKRVHRCDQCGRTIEAGSPAGYGTGFYDGVFYSDWTHVECEAAADDFANLNNSWGEDYPWFQHMDDSEFEHHAWLLENHPIVAERLNIEREEVSA